MCGYGCACACVSQITKTNIKTKCEYPEFLFLNSIAFLLEGEEEERTIIILPGPTGLSGTHTAMAGVSYFGKFRPYINVNVIFFYL